MAENTTEVIVGAVVVAAAVGFYAYSGGVTALSGGSTGYPLTASFRSIEGVTEGTDVRLAGVKIGTVTALDLNRDTYFADAQFTIRDGIGVPDDSAVVISSEGLLGGNFVEILPGGSLTNFDPGSEIEDTQGAVSLISLLVQFVAGGGSATEAQ